MLGAEREKLRLRFFQGFNSNTSGTIGYLFAVDENVGGMGSAGTMLSFWFELAMGR